MSAIIKDLYSRFTEFYQDSIQKRLLVGFLTAIIIFLYFLILSLFLSPFLTTIWGKVVLNDLPGLGLIIGLIIAFQIWGVLPQPPKNT